jgi:hypothetical protein
VAAGVPDVWERVVLCVEDYEVAAATISSLEGCFQAVGVGRDFQSLTSEQSDYVVVCLSFCELGFELQSCGSGNLADLVFIVAELWMAVNLQVTSQRSFLNV